MVSALHWYGMHPFLFLRSGSARKEHWLLVCDALPFIPMTAPACDLTWCHSPLGLGVCGTGFGGLTISPVSTLAIATCTALNNLLTMTAMSDYTNFG